MSSQSRIAIEIASEFTGRKAFDKAGKSTVSLEHSVKKLAKAFAGVFAAQKVLAFGKASVKAFADDQKAATVLTNTLKNLGLAFENSKVTTFIQNLEKSTGILDEQLRPAMQSLLTVTGDVTKSQKLLQLAIDVSAGSGENLATTAGDIAQAYVGNIKNLKKYNLGLTQAELKAASFLDIQKRFTDVFGGSNAAVLTTYAGQINLINVAYDNMQETIGKGLLDSFMLLAGDNGIGGATAAMESFGKTASETILGIAALIKQITPTSGIKGEPGFWHDLYIAFGGQILEDLRKKGRAQAARTTPQAPGAISGKFTPATMAAEQKARIAAENAAKVRANQLLAAERARLANLKKITAEQQKKTALDKLSAVLNQAQKIFDMERIELAAAAMNKQTEEDRVRIRLKTEILDLEEAINSGNVEGATRLASAVVNDAKLLGDLRGAMVSLGDVPNPFEAWLATLQAALAALLALTTVVTIPGVTSMGAGGFNAGSARLGESLGNAAAGLPATGLNPNGFGDSHLSALAGQSAQIVVNVAGSVTTERDLVSAITQGLYNNQASGIPVNYTTAY